MADFSILKSSDDITRLVEIMESCLGEALTPFEFDDAVKEVVSERIVRRRRRPIGNYRQLLELTADSYGRRTVLGAMEIQVDFAGSRVELVELIGRQPQSLYDGRHEREECHLWLLRNGDVPKFYRYLRNLLSQKAIAPQPLLDPSQLARVWDNTIGFLDKADELKKRFQVKAKRGVLLSGPPGNGKTMAARWLKWSAEKRGYYVNSVRAEDLLIRKVFNKESGLFDLPGPGLVIFDDIDAALHERGNDGTPQGHSVFLAGLDGMKVRSNIVYVFTTNARLDQLDEAFRRPGRIDVATVCASPKLLLHRFKSQHCWGPAIGRAAISESLPRPHHHRRRSRRLYPPRRTMRSRVAILTCRHWRAYVQTPALLVVGATDIAAGGPFTSVLVGYYEDRKLIYAGKVKAGFIPHVRRSPMSKLERLKTASTPFDELPLSKRGALG